MERRYINLPGRPGDFPFSDGVLVGDTLYIAGRIGIDPATGYAPADVEQEIRFLLDSVRAILRDAGMSMDDLVSATVFCPDLSLFDRFNAIYRGYFKREYPARAFIGSGPLLRNGRFEMIGVAIRR
jgi:2-iminobutanoate/2-iminopropanoate deaminase